MSDSFAVSSTDNPPLLRRLFIKSPASKVLFGFPASIDPSSKDLLQSRRFKMHAVYMIQVCRWFTRHFLSVIFRSDSLFKICRDVTDAGYGSQHAWPRY